MAPNDYTHQDFIVSGCTVTSVYEQSKGERLKLWDYDEPTMKLSDMKARARLFRCGIN